MIFKTLLLLIFSANTHAAPTPERILEIRSAVNQLEFSTMLEGVELKVNDQLPGPAWSFMNPAKLNIIEYNPAIYMTLNRSGRDFVMFHELGHIRLGHTALPYPGVEGAREFELEADAFATFAWSKFQQGTLDELKEFFALIGARETIPTGQERVELCESILNQISGR